MLKYATIFMVSLLTSAWGHMSVQSPCVRGFPTGCGYEPPDNDINAPLNFFENGEALCDLRKPYAKPVATLKAGDDFTVKFREGGATHGGGHCEFSVSYDGGKTLLSIYQIVKDCFKDNKFSYTFKLPSDLPSSDNAIFAWSWVNAIGNREFYLNCADVAIDGVAGGSFSAPEIVIANLPGYPEIPEFAVGPDKSELYSGRKSVTVSADGQSKGNSTTGPPSSEEGSSEETEPEEETSTDDEPSATISEKSTGPTNETSTDDGPSATHSADDTEPANETSNDDESSATHSADDTEPANETSNDDESSATHSADDTEPTSSTGEEETTPDSPTSGNSTQAVGKTTIPHCKKAGSSPEIITTVNGKDVITTCSGDMVCNEISGGGAFCDIAKA